MISKKIIFGSVTSVAIIILVVTTLPIFIYGYTVNVVEIDTSFKISSSVNSSPLLSFNIKISQGSPVKFSVGNPSIQVNKKTMNAYEYIMAKGAGLIDTSEEEQSDGDEVEQSGGAEVELILTYNLTTPSGQKINLIYDLRELRGIGVKHIKILLGPEQLKNEYGTFSLLTTISIKITPPPFDTPVVERTLKPVYREFVISEKPEVPEEPEGPKGPEGPEPIY